VTQVVVSSTQGLRQEVLAGSHTLAADEPETAGGTDSGPNPYELLLAALGACTAMTIRLYADSHDLPLDGIEIRLTHDRIYARDCADCEAGNLDRVEKEIVLKGALSEEQLQRLGEIAEKCPVNRTLTGRVVTCQEVRRAMD
jgi:uncharacterized OsmC-like protein